MFARSASIGDATEHRALNLLLSRTPQIMLPSGAVLALAPRDAALLAWLALEGPTPRARLAHLLWPASSPEAARNALRQRLFHLRRQLGADLVDGHATLALAAGTVHDLDEADEVLGAHGEDFGGELGEWLAQQRARRKARVQRSLAELADMAERAKDFDDALAHAGELLSFEPLSEEAHRRVMRLHYLRGDRAAALLAFDRCERVLKDEVGARPAAETLALLATLEAAAQAPADAATNALPASVSRPPRLIGRARELGALAQGWEGGQVIALIGEAGLGKTRLLQEFADGRPGVVRAAGRPGDAGVPFATLARLLRAVTALAGDGLALPAATRSEIARVLPEFDAAGARHAGEGQRMVLLRAVRALLAAQPTLAGLIVDDLHFADEASLEMLGSLIDDDGALALRWALAYRPAETGSPVQLLHDGLVEQARLVPVTLPPLDAAALAELVDSLALPGISGAVLAPGLLRRTGGNPLFVLETLKQAWVERTLARLADAQGQALALPRPLSVGRLIERRVAQLSPAALALARVASIAGVDFGIALAEQVLGVSAMQFADALNELEAAQVLRGNAFAHDLVFEAVHASVPATIAVHTHAQVALWLEAHEGVAARIARHWIAAAQGARALPWLVRAAASAGAAARRKEQIGFLEQQSAIEEAAGDRAAAFASQMLAAELQVTVDSEGARSLAQCDRLDALAADATQRIRAQVQRAHLTYMRGDLQHAQALIEVALRESQRLPGAAALMVECRQHLATVLALQDSSSEAIVQFEACASWIDEHADAERRCDFHGNLALAYDNCGRLADARLHHELAIDLAQQAQHHGNVAMCLNNYAANRILGGRLREGEALLLRLRQVCARAEDGSSVEGFAAMLQAICDYQSGRYRAALRALADSDERLARFAPGFRRSASTHLAVCWAQLGQWSRLQHLLAEWGDAATISGATALRLATLRYQMDQALGRPADVAALEAALSYADGGLRDMRHMVEIELASAAGAAAGLDRLEDIAAEAASLGHGGTVVAARARAARIAAAAGDAKQARQQARAALAQAEQHDVVRHYPAELWLHCGAALAAIGDTEPARDVLQRGRDWVQAIARDEVPEEFRSSFLERNPVNRELLALAARLTGA